MATKLQILRNVGATAVAVPTLLEGELAFAKGGFTGGAAANGLVVGDGTAAQVLVGSNRQVELTGNQTIASGTKTFAAGAKLAIAVADLTVSGGAAGNTLITDGSGNLSWGVGGSTISVDGTTIVDNNGVLSVAPGYAATIADGVTILADANGKLTVSKAVTADVAAGTANKFVDTALLKTDVLGGTLASLSTTAKTLVPAINEIYTGMAAMSGGVIFAGTLDATTGDITAASGVANVPANIADVDPALCKNYFWIVTVPGSVVGTGNTVAASRQDWVASDGTKLVTLNYGMPSVAAANVSFDGAGNTYAIGANVQDAIDQLDAALKGPIDGGTFA
jgi:hypothetical protein